MSAGSCFASNIRRYLDAAGLHYVVTEKLHPNFSEIKESPYYEAFSARYGNIYTARQMSQLLKRAMRRFEPAESVWCDGDSWIDPFRPGLKFPARSREEFQAQTRQHLDAVREAIEKANVFIFTLGLTEAWVCAEDGAVFPACPGTVAGTFDPNRHRFHNFTVEEVAADLEELVSLLREITGDMKVIFTVSPVPLVATATGSHVLLATTYSKSVLRVAADLAANKYDNACYFPAYELVVGPQASQDAFLADRRSVSESAVARVMAAFFETYMNEVPKLPSADETPGESLGSESLQSGSPETSGVEQENLDTLIARVAAAIEAECEEEMAGR